MAQNCAALWIWIRSLPPHSAAAAAARWRAAVLPPRWRHDAGRRAAAGRGGCRWSTIGLLVVLPTAYWHIAAHVACCCCVDLSIVVVARVTHPCGPCANCGMVSNSNCSILTDPDRFGYWAQDGTTISAADLTLEWTMSMGKLSCHRAGFFMHIIFCWCVFITGGMAMLRNLQNEPILPGRVRGGGDDGGTKDARGWMYDFRCGTILSTRAAFAASARCCSSAALRCPPLWEPAAEPRPTPLPTFRPLACAAFRFFPELAARLPFFAGMAAARGCGCSTRTRLLWHGAGRGRVAVGLWRRRGGAAGRHVMMCDIHLIPEPRTHHFREF
eukprot:COSAG01_NODE_5405_length_4282_cov_3.082955_1_plen_328_part_00